jgi:hypothetical protein
MVEQGMHDQCSGDDLCTRRQCLLAPCMIDPKLHADHFDGDQRIAVVK